MSESGVRTIRLTDKEAAFWLGQGSIVLSTSTPPVVHRVQTGLDRVQTGFDRVQTGDDAVATAADALATGADREAVAADALATGADREAVAADKIAAETARDSTYNLSTTYLDIATGRAASLTARNSTSPQSARQKSPATDAICRRHRRNCIDFQQAFGMLTNILGIA